MGKEIQTAQTGGIYKAILNIMRDVGAIGKDQVNQAQRFKYRGIDQVMNALQPAFINNGVFVYPEIVDHIREERESAQGKNLIYSVITVRYHFTHEDGSEIVVTVIGEGMDYGDKATNKALSIAFKYACFQVFCIPTEEMRDPDAESPETKKLDTITDAMKITIIKEMERTGVNEGAICDRAKVKRLDDIPAALYAGIMNGLKKTPDKA